LPCCLLSIIVLIINSETLLFSNISSI
jgi:hypothetical protein